MKKFKTKIVAILAGVLVFFGIGISPALASAKSVTELPETNTEIGVETDEIVDNEETLKEEITIDLKDISYEKFLEIVSILAEETGNGDLWEDTLASVKKAIDEKQFTIAIVLIIIACVAIVFKIILDAVFKFKEKAHILQTEKDSKTIKAQTTALNGMIDEEEKIAKNVTESVTREKTLAAAGLEQNAALRCLVRGVQLHDTAREEALRHLNNSDEKYDQAKK